MHNSSEMAYPIKVEYAEARRMRERNTRRYRLAHLPIWIWVFFLAPGPLTFDLFAHGGSGKNLAWLVAGDRGNRESPAILDSFPGVEPRPYILRFTEDKPNPLYRKICYTVRVERGHYLHLAEPGRAGDCGRDRQVGDEADLSARPIFRSAPWCCCWGFWGCCLSVGRSTKGEGIERRYFYGAVWAAVISQTLSARAVEDTAQVSGD